MGNFNTLYRGGHDEVLQILEEHELDEQELRAALINAFNRIRRLEAAAEKIEKRGHER